MKRGPRKQLNMAERRVLVKAFAGEYRRAGKKQKGTILDQLEEATGYERHYAARLLRGHHRSALGLGEKEVAVERTLLNQTGNLTASADPDSDL
jgi:hypothetical protein